MPKRQLNDKETLQETGPGMDHAASMQKSDLPKQDLQNALTKLAEIGVLQQTEPDGRTSVRKGTVNGVWKCPACEKEQQREFDECPSCGVIVRKYNSRVAPLTASDTERPILGITKVVWGVVCLLLLVGVGAGWYLSSNIAQQRRIETARLEQQRIEEQQKLQDEADDRAEETRMQSEAERQEKELQRLQDKDMEEWRSQEEDRVIAEEQKQRRQDLRQASKERRARLRVDRAYLNMMKLARDMYINALGENVSRAIPGLKARAGQFNDGLLVLKRTPGADPEVVDHFDKAFNHLMGAFKARLRKEKYDAVKLWWQECRSAFAE